MGSGAAVLKSDHDEHDGGCSDPEMYRSELWVNYTQMPPITLGGDGRLRYVVGRTV